jgi:RNA-binding motif protein, X-linked 2
MNQIREVQRINQEELSRGIAGTNASWHAKYATSAWVFVGNMDYKLTEGDVIAVLSEYGEIEDFHLVRDEETGKSKGFCFCKYDDARSCVLAVDNLCGVEITAGRSLRVDHVESYRLPKSLQDKEEELQKRLLENQGLEGHAYEGVELENKFSLHEGQDLFAKKQPQSTIKKKNWKEDDDDDDEKQREKEKKRKRKEEKREAKESRKRERAQIRQERDERRRENRAKKIHDHDDDDSRKESHHHAKKHKRSKRDDKKKRKKSEEHIRSNSPTSR